MPFVEVHGVDAHYADDGRGPPVLFVHAATQNATQWDEVRAYLTLSVRALLPDLYGCGRTADWPGPGDLTMDEEADIVLAVMQRIDGLVHLVGHSYGGAVALRAAVRAPQILRSLCLIEPGGVPLLKAGGRQDAYDEYVGVMDAFLAAADAGDPVAAWRGFLNYYRARPDAWDMLDADMQAKIVARTGMQRQVYRAQMSNPTTLEEVRALDVPTLLITGGATTLPERAVCDVLLAHLPSARMHTIPGAAHPMPTTHPLEVAETVSAHLARFAMEA